ncbi:PREDICTED: von Willebrand factor A domain-containing protein 5B1-like [Branchiostoma belcheri]|uniref:von Willebrand factor A domain-containing protein 5B1-like n=1 Tax=Branchiostoma belcheri TaxID=7741 RepID=A0A6P4Z2H8_BRABE|nr:PREDICTED: von Willebrand factor A domain-containing protein 5B1-like [Branchiostoma belcheri]
MPRLLNWATRTRVPLKSVRISACMMGHSLGMTSSFSYYNDQDYPLEVAFIYPLDNKTTVVGFDAMIAGRTIGVQLRERKELDYIYDVMCSHEGLHVGQQFPVLLEEHLAAGIFAVNVGTIPARETATVIMSTSSRVENNSSGALRFKLSDGFCPRQDSPTGGIEPDTDEDDGFSSVGTRSLPVNIAVTPTASTWSLTSLLQETTHTQMPYDFDFHLQVKMPCLLSGVSSPTHAIRVDADPFASSANEVFVTLAEPHTFDKCLEVLIHLEQPHQPIVVLEHGHSVDTEETCDINRTSGFATPVDSPLASSFEIIEDRICTDFVHNPVLMLNYCPDFSDTLASNPKTSEDIQGEYVAVIDRSGSMSGAYIATARETLLLFLKSLPSGSAFNVVGFGSTYKPLFDASVPVNQENVDTASSWVCKMRADLGGTNLIGPLEWIFSAPRPAGRPREVFILTDGAVSNTNRVIDLVRANSSHTRCWTVGIGEGASRALIRGIAEAGRGRAEFVTEVDRMQAKLLLCLKRSLQPAICDVNIEWKIPDGVQLVQTPCHLPNLYPGDTLTVYGLLWDEFNVDQSPFSPLHGMNSRDSFSEKKPLEDDLLMDIVMGVTRNKDPEADVTKQDEEIIKRDEDLKEKDIDENKHHDLPSPDNEKAKPGNEQLSPDNEKLKAGNERRTSTSKDNLLNNLKEPHVRSISADASYVNTPSPLGTSGTFEHLEWDSYIDERILAAGLEKRTEAKREALRRHLERKRADRHESRDGQCVAVIRGTLCGKEFVREVPFDISEALDPEITLPSGNEDSPWDDVIHQLAATTLIRDFEDEILRKGSSQLEDSPIHEAPMEDAGSLKEKIVELSQAANIPSRLTTFVAVDELTGAVLPPVVHNRPRDRGKKRAQESLLRKRYSADKIPGSSASLPAGPDLHKAERFILSKFGSFSKLLPSGTTPSKKPMYRPVLGGELIPVSGKFARLVELQMADGAWQLDASFSDVIDIPLETLYRACPMFDRHDNTSGRYGSAEIARRDSDDNTTHCWNFGRRHKKNGGNNEAKNLKKMMWQELNESWKSVSPALFNQSQAAQTTQENNFGGNCADDEDRECVTPESNDMESTKSRFWATLVALGWLEKKCVRLFEEWELMAGKAETWLATNENALPKGWDLLSLKAAAMEVLVLLR